MAMLQPRKKLAVAMMMLMRASSTRQTLLPNRAEPVAAQPPSAPVRKAAAVGKGLPSTAELQRVLPLV